MSVGWNFERRRDTCARFAIGVFLLAEGKAERDTSLEKVRSRMRLSPEEALFAARRLDEEKLLAFDAGGAVRSNARGMEHAVTLMTDEAAPPERATDDVDGIVSISSRVEYYELANELRALGFREDSSKGVPMARRGVIVDVMPDRGEILSFGNRWYTDAITHALEPTVEGETFKIVSAPYFCATKLEAFSGRGKGDFYHHDLEDIIAVVDGRRELVAEVKAAPADVRDYIAKQLGALLASPAFMEALPGHLPGDAASQARLPTVTSRLVAAAASAQARPGARGSTARRATRSSSSPCRARPTRRRPRRVARRDVSAR